MIAKNWPTELKKMSDSQAVIFRRRSRGRTLLEQGTDRIGQSMRSLFEEISSSSDNLSIIGLSSKNANPSSSPSSKDGRDEKATFQKPAKGEPTVELSTKESEKKEKKRKALSSSRQKKFFRHFPQVNPDEHVINYFSCALVSDILLQGHMYITNNYFAFYSNVFGFVTKLLIPVVSVERISKEKTAKIIPNAIGVATLDERHVFGSFMSRESAYRLMLSVWRPTEVPETPTANAKAVPDVEISECSIEEDSSCSVSGNESPTQSKDGTPLAVDPAMLLRQRIAPVVQVLEASPSGGVDQVDSAKVQQSGEASGKTRARDDVADGVGSSRAKEARLKFAVDERPLVAEAKGSRLVSFRGKLRKINLKFPTDIHIVYLGVVLAIILALFSGFLLYRIMDIQSRTNSLDYKWKPNREMDVYEEVLKWQREIQERSVEETQNILSINLEQILKVRKSLESLSALISGRRESGGAKALDGSVKT